MITISVCMIVKNEEKTLARCLDSLQGLAEEYIIVDTGSTDATKEIAALYTDKIYDYTWIDDFADARNFSFSKATMDYIYCADADEVLDEENRKRFMDMKQVLLPEIDMVQMKYCNQLSNGTVYNFDEEYRPKLYKRLREFVWIDPVHESVRLMPVIYDSEISILHMAESGHGKRDFGIFERTVNAGTRLSKKLHHMYAQELYISGDDEDFIHALPCFLNTFEDELRDMDEVKEAACVVARAYRVQNNIAQFFKYALKDVAAAGSAEICCELGKYYESVSDYKEAFLWYYNAWSETECILAVRCAKEVPLQGMIRCCEQQGDIKQAEQYRALL